MNPQKLIDTKAVLKEISWGSLGNLRPIWDKYKNAPRVLIPKSYFLAVIPKWLAKKMTEDTKMNRQSNEVMIESQDMEWNELM